jgi:hypothetical protein
VCMGVDCETKRSAVRGVVLWELPYESRRVIRNLVPTNSVARVEGHNYVQFLQRRDIHQSHRLCAPLLIAM